MLSLYIILHSGVREKNQGSVKKWVENLSKNRQCKARQGKKL
jgi:hypothetical protein